MSGNGDPYKRGEGRIMVNPQHVVDILRYCVRQYTVEHELDTAQAEMMSIDKLVDWCVDKELPLSAQDEILSATYKGTHQPQGSRITPQAIDMVWEQLQDPYSAVKLLWPVWEWLILKRPLPKAKVSLLQLSAHVAFEDGKALEIQIPTDLRKESVTEGFLCSLIKNQVLGMVASILTNGIDALHEKYAIPIEATPEITKAPENDSSSPFLGIDS